MMVQTAAETNVGRRERNQDAFCVSAELGLYVVADGMGGYAGGELASALTVQAVERFVRRNARDSEATWPRALRRDLSFKENLLRVSFDLAHGAVTAQRVGDNAQMGSTVAAVLLDGCEIAIGHVGDSRVYRLRGDQLLQLTRDHSLYEELRAASAELPARESFGYSNVITRAIGIPGHYEPDLRRETVQQGDLLLLCSDGLTERLDATTLQQLLLQHPVEQAASALVERALASGSRDNITVVLVHVVGAPEGSSSATIYSSGASASSP